MRLAPVNAGQPEPKFCNICHGHDASHVVSFHDVVIDHEDGKRHLFQQFQNYGDKPCTVAIEPRA